MSFVRWLTREKGLTWDMRRTVSSIERRSTILWTCNISPRNRSGPSEYWNSGEVGESI